MCPRVCSDSGGRPQPAPDYRQPPRSAYIHVPFCVRKCGYCSFASFSGCYDQVPAYFEALDQEIVRTLRWQAAQPAESGGGLAPLDTVYFGGGTPGSVDAAYLTGALDRLRQTTGLAPDAEITVEVNPGAMAPGLLPVLRTAGFNRLSIGLQAAQPHLLAALGRIHRPDDFSKLVSAARSAGWERISGDMMLGLPGQRVSDVLETVDFLLHCGVQHVSFYSLTIEPETPFAALYADGAGLPDGGVERRMYVRALRALKQKGFRAYEISNAAVPGCESRHNLVYWAGRPYYGFGCGASAFLCGGRRRNPSDLSDYFRMAACSSEIQHPEPGSVLEEQLDDAAAMREFFLLGFRRTAGVRLSDFRRQFGRQPDEVLIRILSDLKHRGLIHFDGERARLSGLGLNLANQVFMAFV